MAKPVVFVIGASGNIGLATVQALADKYARKVEIRAGTRNPDKDKADMLRAIPNITLVQAEMGEKVKLKETLKGVDALYIVTPPGKERVALTVSTAEVAKEAGVKHLLVVSGFTAALPDTIIGKQYGELEDTISRLGVPYTILRLPFFLDDVKTMFKESIKERGVFSSGFDGSKPFTTIVVADAGNASAAILADQEKHANKTYKLISDCFTYDGIAAAFSEVLGKSVTYTYVPFDRQASLAAGIPERAVDITEQLIKLVNNGCTVFDNPDLTHYQSITGEQPTSMKSWVSQVKEDFK